MLFEWYGTTLAILAKVCSEDSVQFKLVNERFVSSSVADNSLANVGLDWCGICGYTHIKMIERRACLSYR